MTCCSRAATIVAAALALATPAAAEAAPPAHASPSAACAGASSTAASNAVQRTTMRCLINAVRRQHGLRALRGNATLDRAARLKASRIGNCGQFTHTPCGAPFTQVFRAAGWHGGIEGENIAYGSEWLGSPQAILQAWMASPGHRANLLRRSFHFQGLAVSDVTLAGVGPTRLWVNSFG